MSLKGKPIPAAFGTWLMLAQVSTGLKWKRSCRYKAEGPPANGVTSTGRGKGGGQQSENAQGVSLLVAHRHWLSAPARLPKTDGKGFPHISQRRLLVMVSHLCSTALCWNSSSACLGHGIQVHTLGTSVDTLPRSGSAPLQPTNFAGHK